MTKETLILTAVHGDEAFSIPIVEKLKSKFNFDSIVANPQALTENQRYLEADLNRSGPGNPDSKLLEERLAFRLIQTGSEYQQVIDIHGAESDCGIFIILGDPNWKNIELAKNLDIGKVVLWPGLLPTGPLCQFIPNSLEIQCGPKNSPQVAQDLEKVLNSFFEGETRQEPQQFFIVTGRLSGLDPKGFKDFEEASVDGIKFFPLFPGLYPGIACCMMQKLNNDLSF
ncbi:MAG: Succinylglutamate desuccinylase/aspartoacylase [Candidatus Beckwithbacteria bacterium GW2011_GWB1_47_15]|uniref:Succinylglutamate desuccinylase/aspartoacylase n=1 Tax=Candidatus Beckwithbacteria bacterium GW2011_GWB1_47_15 TaxID=1618371 RepID=A0A0G1RW90_9BACT|nr:MAG: succinylglutamate desuccinylase/aspartoacylase [Candidatus Beckwithbacteria bacterium GW2011_GWC1_49_16]KKU35317.1 MAG: Succinylglutamate desuccinylase/aspartoacylase [Candidatus Beckwithbacteria bacterium GW2011_GWA1_46_30]KKU61412.1 MAG: Succinylglutamate desuccinylase/aspartoacylase [Candidatus Beckwithbacteria bacterium GW2011_GWB1_47_15]KKU71819.1 MAG: Succinylglutamate desuccinylase/aspartoacylase [Candidatus Beckwithbacteria bacterium GW2011_GWA2_47_25]KKW03713.1 MAG: Succinylglu